MENDDLILFNIPERHFPIAEKVVQEIHDERKREFEENPVEGEEYSELLYVNPTAFDIFGKPIAGMCGIEAVSYDLRYDAEKAFNRLYDVAILEQMEKEKRDGFDV